MIKMIPTVDGRNYAELTRSSNDILQTTWPSLSKIIASGLERLEPILRENKEGEENTRDFDENDSNLSEVSANGSRNSDEEPSNSDGIEAWGTANLHLFSVLRQTTKGAARSILGSNSNQETVNHETVERLSLRKKTSIITVLASVGGHCCGG